MVKVYEVSCGDWSSKFRTNDLDDLKTALIKEINRKSDRNTQLGFFIYVREIGGKKKDDDIFCLANEVLIP